MPEIIHITDRPTLDLTNFNILEVTEEGMCFVQSQNIFKFDHVYGNLENRSRILRLNKNESRIVEQIISATIDAGFCGPIVWKTKLTKFGYDLYTQTNDNNKFREYLIPCQQIHLFASPAGNYYDRVVDNCGNVVAGTSQTDLEPDIIFKI